MRSRLPLLIALIVGILVAPLVLPLLASWGGPARAQSLPWTPTPTPTGVPPVAAATPTVLRPTPTTSVLPTPTRDPALPILPGTAIPITPVSGDPGDPGPNSPAPRAPVGNAPTAPPTATPAPGTQPDRCEPNDALIQPCALPTEIDNADLNVVDGTPDVFSFLLKGGRTYTIRASSTTGIDPVIRVFRADDPATVIAENDDLAPGTTDAEVQVTTEVDGWYLVLVTNKAPGDMRGRTYTVSARSTAALAPTTNPAAATQAALTPVEAVQGDLFENNYSPETAATLAWGVPYDLSLVCPVAGGCPNGDHDFFWVPVKQAVPLVAVTYDLGPGADTTLTLYRPEPGHTDPATGLVGWRHWAGNDDIAPGYTLRSQLIVTPDWDGYTLLIVASSQRANPPPMPPAVGPAGRYRLMLGPPALAPVQDVLDAQRDIPAAPTPLPVEVPPTGEPAAANVAPTPITDAREVIRQESLSGEAVVVVPATRLYAAAPPSSTDELASYPEGAVVSLLGVTYAGWVKVQPLDSVTPGWMFGPNLRPRTPLTAADLGATGTITGTATAPGTGSSSAGTAPTSAPDGGAASVPQVAIMPPLPAPTAVTVPPEARAVTVEVCAVARVADSACTRPLEGIRVELVRVSDHAILFVGLTDRAGQVAPSIQLAPGTAVDLQIGALGLRARIPATASRIPVRVMAGVTP